MASLKHKEYSHWVLQEVGKINPYNRSMENLRSEYYIYQSGFLASYLASLLEEDVILRRQFEKHIASMAPLRNKGEFTKRA